MTFSINIHPITTATTTCLTATAVTVTAVMALLLMEPTGAANSIIQGGTPVPGKRLVRASYCEGQVLSSEYRLLTTTTRSTIECVGQCNRNSDCLSVVYEADTGLCHHGNAMAQQDCSNMEAGAPTSVFYQRPTICGVNEVPGPSGNCVCTPQFYGTPCVRHINDCEDLRLAGLWTEGDRATPTIWPLNGGPEGATVSCRLIQSTGRARTAFMNRRLTSVSFNRTYQEYKDGFGDVDADFWIGLQNLHLITSDRDYKMVVSLKVMKSATSDKTETITSIYYNFRITDEASGYKIHFNSSNVASTDCLFSHHGAQFSARDHDRDESDSVDCADLRKGGFWYRGDSCSACNPFGLIYDNDNYLRLNREDEIFWPDKVGNRAVKKIHMYLIKMTR